MLVFLIRINTPSDMKKNVLLAVMVLIAFELLAQSPDSFNYQAVLRNPQGDVLSNTNVNIDILIRKNVTDGDIVYSERFNKLTSQFGQVELKIGKGNTSDSFANIEWDTGWYFLEIKVDGVTLGTTQLISVPYAKFADKAGNTFSGNYNDLDNIPDFAELIPDFTGWDKDESDDFSGYYDDLINIPEESEPIDTSHFISLNNPSEGDIAYFNGKKWELLVSGNEDEVLMIGAGVPSWKFLDVEESVKRVGELYLGGIIYYVSPDGQSGLIASLEDLDGGGGVEWSDISNLESKATSFYNGSANTDSILSQGAANSAAQLCKNYGAEWYLPSAWELHLMHIAAYEINKILDNDSDSSTHGIQISTDGAEGRYWSSTEVSNNRAWSFMFNYGYTANSNKSTPCRLRAVRAF